MTELEQDTWQVRLEWAEKNPEHELSPSLRLLVRIMLKGVVETDEDIPLRQSFQ